MEFGMDAQRFSHGFPTASRRRSRKCFRPCIGPIPMCQARPCFMSSRFLLRFRIQGDWVDLTGIWRGCPKTAVFNGKIWGNDDETWTCWVLVFRRTRLDRKTCVFTASQIPRSSIEFPELSGDFVDKSGQLPFSCFTKFFAYWNGDDASMEHKENQRDPQRSVIWYDSYRRLHKASHFRAQWLWATPN